MSTRARVGRGPAPEYFPNVARCGKIRGVAQSPNERTSTMPQSVVIIGPNLQDQDKGQFHVHAAGCADITRDPKHYGYRSAGPHMMVEAKDLEAVAEYVYEDHMAEAEPGSAWTKPEAYLPDFHFAPCVTLEGRADEPEVAPSASTYPTPILGTRVRIWPIGSDTPWEAKIVGFTQSGELRVRTTAVEDSTVTQTISRDARVEVAS